MLLHNPPAETEPRRVLDVVCDSRQLPNGLIFNNITWTIPSDAATVESVSEFVVWWHRFPDISFARDSLDRDVIGEFDYQVSIYGDPDDYHVTMVTIM